MRKYLGEIGLILTALIWGMGFVASDISLNYYTPIEALALRFSIAAICMSLIFFKKLKNINKTTLVHGILIGFFLYSAFLLQTIGLFYTTPSNNAFLTSINVVIVPFIAFVIYKRKIDIFTMTGAVLSIIGVGIISLKPGFSINIGDFLTILCAVCFALHIFYTSEFLNRGTDPISLTILQMLTAATISIIIFFITKEPKSIPFEKSSFYAILYLGLISTTLAFFLQTVSQKYTSETKAAIFLSTESLFGTIFSVLILSEKLSFRALLGCFIIFAAVIISEVKPNFLAKKEMSS